MIGTWVLYIPFVKNKLSLNDAQLGFALFCLALGILVFLPLVPFFTKKIGLGKTTFLGVLLFSLSFTTPVIASSYVLLCISLFVVGMFSGCTDVAMNALISEIEKRDNKHLMSSSHGFFSLGGVIGGLLGTLLLGFFIEPFYHLLLMSSLIILSNVVLTKHYYYIEEESVENNKKSALKSFRYLLPLSIIAFIIMASEGAIEHWSSLYLIDIVLIEKKNLAGIGFILFSIAMTIGRFFGDGISVRLGSVKTMLYGCIIAAIGYILVLLSHFILSVIGFGIIGLGLSVIIPELFRIAGKSKGASSSANISFVSGIGFVGFLLGPVCLGFISNTFNLKVSFTVLLLILCGAIGITLFKFLRH